MAGLREFFESGAGKIAAIGVFVVALIVAVFMFRNSFGTSSVVSDANTRVFIDKDTGKPFTVEMRAGMKIPLRAPSGHDSGYPAELCWWTKDGKIRKDPYPVLLNSVKGRPEPTFCDDCGRLVVGHNPKPATPDTKPPPTKEQYEARRQKTPNPDEGRDR
jgi:hypothetical protein